MVPDIGLMIGIVGVIIGFYIVTRMLQIYNLEKTTSGTQLLCVVTMLVAIVGMVGLVLLGIDLLMSGLKTASAF